MNNQQLDSKIRRDGAKIQTDLGALAEDSTARLNRVESDVSRTASKTKEDLTAWVEGSVTQLGAGIEKLSGETKEAVAAAAATVKKEVGHGLSQYNAKAQEVADKVPGQFGKKAAGYPWVAISIALVVGFLLGGLLKPSRQVVGWF
jgi:ElaB/YqjD/DUF883 family membrane-anchored ribosome-binding protein